MDFRLRPRLARGAVPLRPCVRSIRTRTAHGLALAALVCITTNAKAADPTPADREKARNLMDEGHALREQGMHADALSAFMKADDIMHVPTTGLAVAQEQIEIANFVEAETALFAIVRTPAKGREPEPFKRARIDAQKALAALGPRIPTLEIAVVGGSEGVIPEVSLDTVVLSQAARANPIRTNPGHHVIEANASTARARLEIDLAEGESKSITLTPQAEPSSTLESPSVDEAPEAHAPPIEPTPLGPYLWWGGAGIASVGIVAGTVTGIISLSAASAAKQGCTSHQCPPSTWSDLDRAQATATISTVSFIVAGVGLGALGVSLLLPAQRAPNTAGVPRVEPWISAASAGVRGTF
jgi:hypothetical protein